SDWYEGVYINRFTSGVFTPGSIFKIITGICAIENIPDIFDRTFTCDGASKIGSGEVICNSVHGEVTFEQALNRSCNSAFSLIADELGKEKLTATVRALGLGKNISFGRITTYRSTFDISKSSALDIGWAGIGQYTTLVNPCQMMVLMGAIANGGTAVNPYLVKDSSVLGSVLEKEKGKLCSNITLSQETADKMKKLLRSNVENQYYESFRSALEMCGKTGTAEVDGKRPHSWFVGFSQREDLPYAIVVIVENGGSGSSVAIPIANKVMKVIAGYTD
ncbi:MAG: penicillin-binding protein, partial [Clostridia bacterium]|nr:penicillin-binding protein [Clostridia bacterium]